jgi:prevent-host-death family protein
MPIQYTITEARRNLAAIIRELDQNDYIEPARRGEPVAVLVSMRAYGQRLEPQVKCHDAYLGFRKAYPEPDVQPEDFDDVRDRSSGRKVNL